MIEHSKIQSNNTVNLNSNETHVKNTCVNPLKTERTMYPKNISRGINQILPKNEKV